MTGSKLSTAFHVVSVICKPENADTELNRIISKVCETNSQTGLKSLYVQSIIEGRAAYMVSPEEGFTPVSIWTTYPWWRRLLNLLHRKIFGKGTCEAETRIEIK